MAISRVSGQCIFFNNASNTNLDGSSFSLTAGNLLLVAVRYEGGGGSDTATVSFTDTAGNTYTQIGAATDSNGARAHLFKVEDCLGNASNVISGTISAARSFRRLSYAQYTGAATISENGTAITGNGSGTAIGPGSITLGGAGLLVCGISHFNNRSITVGSEFSALVAGGTTSSPNDFHALQEGFPGSGGSKTIDATLSTSDSWAAVAAGFIESAGAATLSAASATPGTTTATISATTDQSTGTLYVVVDTAANLSGVTAAQIKAGQKAGGSAALAAGSAAVSTTSPSVGVTGISATTLYSFAAVQNNANGDSNVVTGTFTTAPVLWSQTLM